MTTYLSPISPGHRVSQDPGAGALVVLAAGVTLVVSAFAALALRVPTRVSHITVTHRLEFAPVPDRPVDFAAVTNDVAAASAADFSLPEDYD